MSLLVLSVILLLILVNALYVAAEFSAIRARRSRIGQRAEDGDRLAQRLLPVLEQPDRLDRYIAACQIGITISSLVLGAFGQASLTPLLAPVLERLGDLQEMAAFSAATTLVLLGLTALQMILGELVPKSLALQFPTALARWTLIPMELSLRALSWFIVVLNGSGILVLRALGVRESRHRHVHSPEEIEYLIGESRRGGLLDAADHERLSRALRLGRRRVEEMMVPRTRIRSVTADAPPEAVLREAMTSPYTRLLVHRGSLDEIEGFIHTLDLARLSAEGRKPALAEVVRPISVVAPNMSAEQVLRRLRDEREPLALVVDEFGGTSGLVTVGDLLDEIFGGIADEFKIDEVQPQRLPDGRVRLPGELPLDVAERWVGARWRGESRTVGGLVMERLGRVPEPGDSLRLDGIPVVVDRMHGRAVAAVIAAPRPAERREGADA